MVAALDASRKYMVPGRKAIDTLPHDVYCRMVLLRRFLSFHTKVVIELDRIKLREAWSRDSAQYHVRLGIAAPIRPTSMDMRSVNIPVTIPLSLG